MAMSQYNEQENLRWDCEDFPERGCPVFFITDTEQRRRFRSGPPASLHPNHRVVAIKYEPQQTAILKESVLFDG